MKQRFNHPLVWLATAAVAITIGVVVLLLHRTSTTRQSPPITAVHHAQNGIEPAYSLWPSTVETNASAVTVILDAVPSGKLTRVGLDKLARRLSVEARKVNPDAEALRVRLFASEDDLRADGSAALVQFEYPRGGKHTIHFDQQRMAALSIPETDPRLLNGDQRRSIFLTLKRAESFGDAHNIQAAAKAVAGRYGLEPQDLQPIREEGERKEWGGAPPSRRKEDTP